MSFFRMHLFHGFHGLHRPHHEPRHHGHPFGHDHRAGLSDGIARRLDLSAAQRERLTELLAQLQRQRTALRAAALGPEIDELLASANFDRAGAARVLDERLAALRDAGPAVVEALGDFFDSLDFEQQQAARFLLRLRRARQG